MENCTIVESIAVYGIVSGREVKNPRFRLQLNVTVVSPQVQVRGSVICAFADSQRNQSTAHAKLYGTQNSVTFFSYKSGSGVLVSDLRFSS